VRPIAGHPYRQLGVRLWGEGAYEREAIDGGETRYSSLSRVAAGDIVVNKIWARHGSVAVVPTHLEDCYVSAEFPTFQCVPDRLDPRWFHWITRARWFWDRCDTEARGTSGKNRIRPERFLAISVPVPLVTEQRRLVARIEELREKVDEATAARRSALKEVEILKARGLDLIFDQTRDRFGTTPFTEVCSTTSGGTPDRSRPDFFLGEIPWIKSGELNDSIIRDAEERITEQAVASSSTKIFPKGTLLIALYGATVGKTGVLGIDAATNQAVCAVFPRAEFERDYVWWFLRKMRPSFVERSFGGAQPNISQRVLREIDAPAAPVPEQRRIVAYLDRLQAKVDALKTLQEKTAAELDALMPSILDKAFRGEL
jgi:type I restriction enzyme S subunit